MLTEKKTQKTIPIEGKEHVRGWNWDILTLHGILARSDFDSSNASKKKMLEEMFTTK